MDDRARIDQDKKAEELALADKLGLGNVCCILSSPGLFIGDRYSAQRQEQLKQCNVGHILNASSSAPESFPADFTYYTIRVSDSIHASKELRKKFDEAHRFIGEIEGVLVIFHFIDCFPLQCSH